MARAYRKVIEQIAERVGRGGDRLAAVSWWRRVSEQDPYSTRVALRVMEALEAAGDRAGALLYADEHAARLREDLGAEPAPEVVALADQWRAHPMRHSSLRTHTEGSVVADDRRERLEAALAGRYTVHRELGAGGMATVYLAEDLKNHRPVAIKVLRPELAAAIGPERFLREIEITARLDHPHILPLLDSGAAEEFLYYVMPYVEGESLRDRLHREKQLPLEDAIQIAREVADALDFAHRHDVVHRDIKPENILLGAGHARVADFGIARAIRAAGGDRLTETGVAVGTPQYMSPEQAGGDGDLDGRSDVYALGCVLYEMLAGQPPFTGPTVESVLRQHQSAPAPPVSTVRPTVPDAVADAVRTALAKAPADRFPSAARFLDALSQPSPGRQPPRRKRWQVPVAVIAGVILIGVAVLVVGSSRSRDGTAGHGPTTRAWMLVAEFDGTADASHRQAARELVRTVLDQSSIVVTVPMDGIRRGLALAGKADTTRLTPGVARELAERGAIPSFVTGRLDRVGGTYSVLVRVLDTETGTVSFTEAGIADGEDDVIPTIDRVARALRARLGERPDDIAATRPLIAVATPSLAAYRAYVRTRDLYDQDQLEEAEAIRLYRRSIATDSGFASAWVRIGDSFEDLGQLDSAAVALKRARDFSGRLTEPELLDLQWREAWVDWDVPTAYRLASESVKRFGQGHAGLAFVLSHMGRWDGAVEVYRQAAWPFGPPRDPRFNHAYHLLRAGRLEEAHRHIDSLRGTMHDRLLFELLFTRLDWSRADSVSAALQDDLTARPDGRAQATAARAAVSAVRGRVQSAESLLAVAIASGMERPQWFEGYQLLASVAAGRPVPELSEGSARDTTVVGLVHRGLRAAMAGDTSLASAYLERVRQHSARELARLGSAPTVVSAWIAAVGGRWEAVTQLAAPTASWVWPHNNRARLYYGGIVQWVLGEAYEQLSRPDSAIVYFERLVAPTAGKYSGRMYTVGFTYSFAQRRLAKLYAELGDDQRAEEHWLTFLETFTDPDPEYEWMVEEARAELQNLAIGR